MLRSRGSGYQEDKMSVSYKGQTFMCNKDMALYVDSADRTLYVTGNIRPVPQPRMTVRSRYANKYHKRYIEWRNQMRDMLNAILMNGVITATRNYSKYRTVGTQGLWFKDEKLKLSAIFGAKPSEPSRYNKDGSPDKRTITDIYNSDLANYVKAWEDVMNGIVYTDDKQIREYGECRATDDRKDYYWIRLKIIHRGNYHSDIIAKL